MRILYTEVLHKVLTIKVYMYISIYVYIHIHIVLKVWGTLAFSPLGSSHVQCSPLLQITDALYKAHIYLYLFDKGQSCYAID